MMVVMVMVVVVVAVVMVTDGDKGGRGDSDDGGRDACGDTTALPILSLVASTLSHPQILEYFDYVFTAVFTVEIVLKVSGDYKTHISGCEASLHGVAPIYTEGSLGGTGKEWGREERGMNVVGKAHWIQELTRGLPSQAKGIPAREQDTGWMAGNE